MYYLSFFDKKTFLTDKVEKLNSYFDNIEEVIAVKCHKKYILILTKSDLLILPNLIPEHPTIQHPESSLEI